MSTPPVPLTTLLPDRCVGPPNLGALGVWTQSHPGLLQTHSLNPRSLPVPDPTLPSSPLLLFPEVPTGSPAPRCASTCASGPGSRLEGSTSGERTVQEEEEVPSAGCRGTRPLRVVSGWGPH